MTLPMTDDENDAEMPEPGLKEAEPELLDENDQPLEGQGPATADLISEETIAVDEI